MIRGWYSSHLKNDDAMVGSLLNIIIDTSILCFDIGLHCFRFLRILTFSWSRCVDYPSFIETASE